MQFPEAVDAHADHKHNKIPFYPGRQAPVYSFSPGVSSPYFFNADVFC
jgi:hypothetical protein